MSNFILKSIKTDALGVQPIANILSLPIKICEPNVTFDTNSYYMNYICELDFGTDFVLLAFKNSGFV